MKKVGIAFLGLGTVGEEVFKLVTEAPYLVDDKLEIEFEIRAIFVRDINKKRNVDVSGIYVTSNPLDIINNPEIHICIECMGGASAEQTIELVEAAIRKGKHIVMSSKKCLAQHMSHITNLACYHNVQLRFEATVGGAIPICNTIMNMSDKNEISKLYGVINATTNYVLSIMDKHEVDMDEALDIAKKMGFTENDPSEDLEGWDAAYKMKILAALGMKLDISCDEIHPVSMYPSDVVELFNDTVKPLSNTVEPANEALNSGKDTSIRQIFYVEKHGNKITYYIGPVRLEKSNMMYQVRDSYNIIFVDSRNSGVRAYYGKGAGGRETASVIYEDLLDVFKRCYWFELTQIASCEKMNVNEIKIE